MSLKTCLLINVGTLLKVLGTPKNLCEEMYAAHVMSRTMRIVLIQCTESPQDCQKLK